MNIPINNLDIPFLNCLWLLPDGQLYEINSEFIWEPVFGKNISTPISNNLSVESENSKKTTLRKITTLFIPGEWVSCFNIELPPQLKRQAKQAIPFALEDQLLNDITEVECLFKQDASGATFVYVIKKNHLSEIKNLLKQASVETEYIYPDFLCVPYDNSVSAAIFNGRLLIRNSVYQGYSFTYKKLEDIAYQLKTLTQLSNFQKPEKIYFFDSNAEKETAALFEEVKTVSCNAAFIEAEQFFKEHHKNLISLVEEKNRAWTHLKNNQWVINSMALTVLLLLSFIFSYYLLIRHYENQTLMVNQQINQLAQVIFPNAVENIDPVLQVQKSIAQRNIRADKGFLLILGNIQNILSPYLINKSIFIDAIDFNNNQLTLTITSKSIQVIQELLQNFTKKNITFTQEALKEKNNQIIAELRFQNGAS